LDLQDKNNKCRIFQRHHDISGVIHFAAKAVGESVENPLLYYENNINAFSLCIAELEKMNKANFILVRLAPFTVKLKQCQLMKMHRFKLRCLYMEIPNK
jgi:UDP-glucose 4-epimerase